MAAPRAMRSRNGEISTLRAARPGIRAPPSRPRGRPSEAGRPWRSGWSEGRDPEQEQLLPPTRPRATTGNHSRRRHSDAGRLPQRCSLPGRIAPGERRLRGSDPRTRSRASGSISARRSDAGRPWRARHAKARLPGRRSRAPTCDAIHHQDGERMIARGKFRRGEEAQRGFLHRVHPLLAAQLSAPVPAASAKVARPSGRRFSSAACFPGSRNNDSTGHSSDWARASATAVDGTNRPVSIARSRTKAPTAGQAPPEPARPRRSNRNSLSRTPARAMIVSHTETFGLAEGGPPEADAQQSAEAQHRFIIPRTRGGSAFKFDGDALTIINPRQIMSREPPDSYCLPGVAVA